jgi:hypothetical protein
MAYRETPNQELTPEPELAVAVYDAPHEAHLAILHLETKGIVARTSNELVVGMAPHLGGGFGGIQVLVRQDLAEEAHQILETLRLELRRERQQRVKADTEAQPETRRTGLAVFAVGSALAMLGWYFFQ